MEQGFRGSWVAVPALVRFVRLDGSVHRCLQVPSLPHMLWDCADIPHHVFAKLLACNVPAAGCVLVGGQESLAIKRKAYAEDSVHICITLSNQIGTKTAPQGFCQSPVFRSHASLSHAFTWLFWFW